MSIMVSPPQPRANQRTQTSSTVPPSPVPAATPPKSPGHKWLPVVLIFAIPLLALAYKLIDSTVHSPAIVWKLQRSQAESKQAQAKTDAESALASTVNRLKSVAENYEVNTQNTQLEVLDEKFVDHGCQAITITGGSKFNEHPIGRNMKCIYVVAQAVRLSPYTTSLADLVDVANQDQSDKIGITFGDSRPQLGVKTYTSDSATSSPLVGYGAEWEYIYNRQWSNIQLVGGSDTKVVYAVSTYYIFFDQDL